MKKEILVFIFRMVWRPSLQILLTMFTFLFIDVNVWSVVFNVLSWMLLFKLFDFSETPEFKEWVRSIVFTLLIVLAFFYLVLWLGGFGILGVILILCLIAGYRIFVNWKLFDYATSWGAKKLFKNSKEEFDYRKAFEK